VPAERYTREIRESSLISGEDGSLRGQSGGCDHEVMSTPGPALLADANEQVRMGLVVVDGLVKFAPGTFDIDEERGVEQQPCQLRSSTVTRSRTAANSARQRESTPCRRSIDFTSEPRPPKTGSIRATALPRRTMVIRSPRCSTASRRSANLRAASVALISVMLSDYQICSPKVPPNVAGVLRATLDTATLGRCRYRHGTGNGRKLGRGVLNGDPVTSVEIRRERSGDGIDVTRSFGAL